jgi:glutamate 5-kinase
METIIVKIWTESLNDFDQNLKVEKMMSDISALMSAKIRVILVSSWAVWEWRKIHPDIQNKALLASIWQPILFEKYRQKFAKFRISTAQFLPAHAQIEDDSNYRQMAHNTICLALDSWIIPIVNENDPFSSYEMNALRRGADNDKNALLMAQLFWAKSIILITNANGVYADFPNAESRLPIIPGAQITDEYIGTLCSEKSSSGTGGMKSKLEIWREASNNNIRTNICDWITTGVFEHSDQRYSGEKWGTVII